MKRIIQGLPFAIVGLWLLTSILVLASASWRPARPPSTRPPPARAPTVTEVPPAVASRETGAPPIEITLPTLVIAGRPPPGRIVPPRARIAEKPAHIWRCSGWRALASGPEDLAVRYCE